jgi:FAD:protein FMN transferase
MGTFVTITLFHSSPGKGQTVLGKAFEQMENLIQIFDRHDNGSPLSYLNKCGFLRGPPFDLVHSSNERRGSTPGQAGFLTPL